MNIPTYLLALHVNRPCFTTTLFLVSINANSILRIFKWAFSVYKFPYFNPKREKWLWISSLSNQTAFMKLTPGQVYNKVCLCFLRLAYCYINLHVRIEFTSQHWIYKSALNCHLKVKRQRERDDINDVRNDEDGMWVSVIITIRHKRFNDITKIDYWQCDQKYAQHKSGKLNFFAKFLTIFLLY